jgi:2-methylcitrate dehydratase PrpD
MMTAVERLARFVVPPSWDDISEASRGELKIRVLDVLGCETATISGRRIRQGRVP